MCGTKDCRIIFRGSSAVRSSGEGLLPSPGVPPKTEPETFLEPPLGESDLEPVVAVVDAKREETDALAFRYVRDDIEDAIDCGSVLSLDVGGLTEGALEGSGGSEGESWFGGVMKSNYCGWSSARRDDIVAL